VPTRPDPGRLLVTRQAILDVVRAATLGSYGVTGFAGSPIRRTLSRFGLARAGIVVDPGPPTDIELDLTVAPGVPVAEVARQVDSAVRYAVRRSLGREIGRVSIHVDGLRVGAGGQPPPPDRHSDPSFSPTDLADSGTDVA
jgi:uncharacterized alkaline shock family protein YloU